MPLGTEVDLSPGHMLDGDPSPPPAKEAQQPPIFLAHAELLFLTPCYAQYVDAVYCYTPSSVVCRSVGLSVANVTPAKVAEPIEMPFGLCSRVGTKDHVLDGGPCEGAILRGRVAHCKVLGLSAASCATRAQQLLRWATVDHSRHGPGCGMWGCCVLSTNRLYGTGMKCQQYMKTFSRKRNEKPAGALVPAFRVIRVARLLTGGARYDLDHPAH